MPRSYVLEADERPPQSFNVLSATGLMWKVALQLNSLKRTRRRARDAGFLCLDIAMSLYHVVDWMYADLTDKQKAKLAQKFGRTIARRADFDRMVQTACEPIRICRIIAVAAKHAKVTTSPDSTVGTYPSFYTKLREGEYAATSGSWRVDVQDKSIPAGVLFQQAFDYWETLMKEIGMIERRFDVEKLKHRLR